MPGKQKKQMDAPSVQTAPAAEATEATPTPLPPLLEVPAEQRVRIAGELIAWYRANKRDLPWRGASPYAVWVSEIMLQQTQVATVIPFFRRFLERFPTVQALAAAPIEEVLKLWAGLGYYARARNLHRAAQLVVSECGGEIPCTPDAIARLPGIGRYTSGAILSIAFNVPRPLVDANVIRVLTRVFGLRGDPKSARNQAALWHLAEQLVPQTSPGDFNQGLMELGALLCEPSDPKCERCPLLPDCVAGNSPDPAALPEFPPGRASIPVTHVSTLIQNSEGDVLLVQRPLHGLWGGLWEFPRVVAHSGETPQEAAVRAASEIVGLDVTIGRRIGTIKHGVTHHRITLYGFLARPVSSCVWPWAREGVACRWIALDALDTLALSSPQVELAALLRRHVAHETGPDAQPTLAFDE